MIDVKEGLKLFKEILRRNKGGVKYPSKDYVPLVEVFYILYLFRPRIEQNN